MLSSTKAVLVIGSSGQIGAELVSRLREIHGADQVIASDIRQSDLGDGPFEVLNVLDKSALSAVVSKYGVGEIYLLAAMLSAVGEEHPLKAWDLNMNGLLNVLELARETGIRVYWPSSIAVFGGNTPKENTPQHTIMEPSTVYGFSKLAGERWCEYYHKRYGVDVRSLRYPGLIGWKTPPGGGTTDYAVHIFHEAIEKGRYASFLSAETRLPMMYMPDAIEATIRLMQAPSENIRIRSSYNLAGFSFTPEELATAIRKHQPEFQLEYAIQPVRQSIADSWPASIDDSEARKDWNWKPEFTLESMTADMWVNLVGARSQSV
jgi:nucleoside-diphosphate-sugar epimerase